MKRSVSLLHFHRLLKILEFSTSIAQRRPAAVPSSSADTICVCFFWLYRCRWTAWRQKQTDVLFGLQCIFHACPAGPRAAEFRKFSEDVLSPCGPILIIFVSNRVIRGRPFCKFCFFCSGFGWMTIFIAPGADSHSHGLVAIY